MSRKKLAEAARAYLQKGDFTPWDIAMQNPALKKRARYSKALNIEDIDELADRLPAARDQFDIEVMMNEIGEFGSRSGSRLGKAKAADAKKTRHSGGEAASASEKAKKLMESFNQIDSDLKEILAKQRRSRGATTDPGSRLGIDKAMSDDLVDKATRKRRR